MRGKKHTHYSSWKNVPRKRCITLLSVPSVEQTRGTIYAHRTVNFIELCKRQAIVRTSTRLSFSCRDKLSAQLSAERSEECIIKCIEWPALFCPFNYANIYNKSTSRNFAKQKKKRENSRLYETKNFIALQIYYFILDTLKWTLLFLCLENWAAEWINFSQCNQQDYKFTGRVSKLHSNSLEYTQFNCGCSVELISEFWAANLFCFKTTKRKPLFKFRLWLLIIFKTYADLINVSTGSGFEKKSPLFINFWIIHQIERSFISHRKSKIDEILYLTMLLFLFAENQKKLRFKCSFDFSTW